MSESVIYCEGFYDRAFWAGWLEHLKCIDPGKPPAGIFRRQPIRDPFGTSVVLGQYAFRTPADRFVRIVPCHGKDQIPQALRIRILERTSKSLEQVVVNFDSDLTASADTSQQDSPGRLVQIMKDADPASTQNAEGDWLLDGGATTVSIVRWQTDDAQAPGIPPKQTLERLICAALAAVYPERATAVQNWLDSRPKPLSVTGKAFAWSHMAGWYADNGCEDFCRRIWDEPPIAAELKSRLQHSGAWAIAERLAR